MRLIEILYFDSCPGWKPTLERVRAVLARDQLDETVSVKTVAVETDEQARQIGFIGSPTVRVNGRDIDPGSTGNTRYGLQCRVYQNEGRLERLPSEHLIRRALSDEDIHGP